MVPVPHQIHEVSCLTSGPEKWQLCVWGRSARVRSKERAGRCPVRAAGGLRAGVREVDRNQGFRGREEGPRDV